MAGNHLEQLVAEWYQFQGYFVRRNVQVGKRPRGGYECELDVVAFNPEQGHLVHVEPSLYADSWETREHRYQKKFDAGTKYIPDLFPGIALPGPPEQIALFVFGGRRAAVGGGRVWIIKDVMAQILDGLRGRRLQSAAVSEAYPLLRTLQFAAQY